MKLESSARNLNTDNLKLHSSGRVIHSTMALRTLPLLSSRYRMLSGEGADVMPRPSYSFTRGVDPQCFFTIPHRQRNIDLLLLVCLAFVFSSDRRKKCTWSHGGANDSLRAGGEAGV
jgi:hypothetical protein